MNMEQIAAPNKDTCHTCGGRIDRNGDSVVESVASIEAREVVTRLACLAVSNPVDAMVMLMRAAAGLTQEQIADNIYKMTGKRPRRQVVQRKLAMIMIRYPILAPILRRR